MIPYFSWNQIDLGVLSINVWGLFVATGFLTAYFLAQKKIVEKYKLLTSDSFLNLTLLIFIFGIIGSRLLWCLENHETIKKMYDIIKVWEGGLSLYGGLIIGSLVALIYLKFKKISIKKSFDLMVVPVIIGLIIGYIGSFLSFDHIGAVTDFWLSRKDSMDQKRHVAEIHQILVLSLTLLYIKFLRKKIKVRRIKSTRYILLVTIYSASRFFIDSLLDKNITGNKPVYLDLLISQIISLVIFGVGFIWLIYLNLYRQRRKRSH